MDIYEAIELQHAAIMTQKIDWEDDHELFSQCFSFLFVGKVKFRIQESSFRYT